VAEKFVELTAWGVLSAVEWAADATATNQRMLVGRVVFLKAFISSALPTNRAALC
jgi:hypothetical protein